MYVPVQLSTIALRGLLVLSRHLRDDCICVLITLVRKVSFLYADGAVVLLFDPEPVVVQHLYRKRDGSRLEEDD